MRAAIASLFALVAAVSAVGDAVVVNNSLDPIYLWSVGDAASEEFAIAPGKAWREEFHKGKTNPGVAIKITKRKDGLYDGAATEILGYSLDGARVWYSLDATNGAPFAGQKLTVTSNGGGSIEWPTGHDIGEVTRDNKSEEDAVLAIYQAN